MEPWIDLHLHSRCSDGEHSVPALLELVHQAGVRTYAITDHDTVQAYLTYPLTCIRGVEISARHDGHNVHILGYGFDEHAAPLLTLLGEIRQRRAARMRLMLEHIKDKHGVVFSNADREKLFAREGTIGKPLVLELLHQYGYGNDANVLEQTYIKGFRSPVTYRATAQDAIAAIHTAGGLAVLAHPGEPEREYGILIETLLGPLCELGLDGLEAYHSMHDQSAVKRYLTLAKEYHLLVSGGSDFHGLFMKPDVKIGHVSKEGAHVTALTLLDALQKRGNMA